MPRDFLHNHRQFADLIRIVAEARGIAPALVEKDYWIMQCLRRDVDTGDRQPFIGSGDMEAVNLRAARPGAPSVSSIARYRREWSDLRCDQRPWRRQSLAATDLQLHR